MSHQERRPRQAVLVGLVLLALCVMERATVSQLTASAPATSNSTAGPPHSSARTATTAGQSDKADGPEVLRSVRVSRLNSGIEVHIEGNRPLKAAATTLSNPERIVVDLASVRYVRTLRIPVNAGDVQVVRVGLYRGDKPITRVVLDLGRSHPYHLLASGNTLTVRVDAKEEKTTEAQSVRTPRHSVVPHVRVGQGAFGNKRNLRAVAEQQPAQIPPPSTVPEVSLGEAIRGNKAAATTDAESEKPAEMRPVHMSPPIAVPEVGAGGATFGNKPTVTTDEETQKPTKVQPVHMPPPNKVPEVSPGEGAFGSKPALTTDAEPERTTEVQLAQMPPPSTVPEASPREGTFADRRTVAADVEPEKTTQVQPAQIPPPSAVLHVNSGESTFGNKSAVITDAEPSKTTNMQPVQSTGPGNIRQMNSHEGSVSINHSDVASSIQPEEATTPHQAAEADPPMVRGVTVSPAKTGAEAPIGGSDRSRNDRFLIGADDVLTVNVWKEPEISRVVPVRSDGKISLPLVGEVEASGRTPQQLQHEISKKLQAYMSEPEVTVIVQQIKSERFNILGQVARPGSYTLTKPMTVVDAIAVAGGFRDFARQKRIYVLRHNPDGSETRVPFNYKEVIRGKSPDRLEVESHDTIVVP